MILFWGLKKFPLRREIPALKDHLNAGHVFKNKVAIAVALALGTDVRLGAPIIMIGAGSTGRPALVLARAAV